MDSEDHHESQSPQCDEKKESPRHSRSSSNSEGRRSRSRSPSERRERPHYEYDDGRNNRNEGNTLYIGNLSSRASEDDLREEFGKLGPIKTIHIPMDMDGVNRGFAFLTFESPVDAKRALDERITLFDRTLMVELSHRNTGYKPTPGAYLGKKSLSNSRRYNRDDRSRRYYDDYDRRRHHSHHRHHSRSRRYDSRDYSRDRDNRRYYDDRRSSRRDRSR